MIDFINTINNFLWSYIIIIILVGCAIYFTIKTRGVQFRMIGEMIRVMVGKEKGEKKKDNGGSKDKIGSFQAFAVALSSRVGTGNLAGVASAIFIGGAGAVFWMWVMALLGSATAFVEATLAQLYKRKGEDSYYGGPAYYMERGLKARWMGIIFAVLITMTFGLANQVVQSNTLLSAVAETFNWNIVVLGIILALITLLIIFGGIHRISKFASICVPFMAIGFIIISLVVILMNITALPNVFKMIFEEAFGIQEVAGGVFGACVMQGVKRGLFSNEAGEGSSPNAAAIAETSHPIKQGLVQALGVFIDTIVICSCTAFIVLISGIHKTSGFDGIILTTHALESEIGVIGRYFITAAILLFAYSTIVANYFYGETNIRFITRKPWAVTMFRILTGVVVLIGALVTLQDAFCMVDLVMGLMTLVNLTALILLSPKVWRLLKDYMEQKKMGKDPEFHKSPNDTDIDCWE